ncbi:MAG TPA: hypothetical protein VGC21_16055 [Telluria sp.]|jgi:hypothetical protein
MQTSLLTIALAAALPACVQAQAEQHPRAWWSIAARAQPAGDLHATDQMRRREQTNHLFRREEAGVALLAFHYAIAPQWASWNSAMRGPASLAPGRQLSIGYAWPLPNPLEWQTLHEHGRTGPAMPSFRIAFNTTY